MPHDNSAQVDVSANRSASKWTPREKLGRVLWGGAAIVFRLVPRPLWGIRRAMLRAFGAKIGANVHIHPTVRIFIPWNITIHDQAAIGDRAILYALGPITIGARSTVSQGAHLCAGSHDWRDPRMPLLKHPIVIGEDAWVAADAFVGPNVVIGPRAIVGARSVVMKPVDADHIVAGNPARLIGHRPASDIGIDKAAENHEI
ncbi:acetyltransferase [Sulfitobacter sp.]|uniref:acetyltransferase n=1 Tax=Sulfitobacter sp. TaxID=1903071 RepID=UPI00356528DD